MAFSESLTVRILGDSSGLRRELTSVADQLDQLEQKIASAGRAGRAFGEAIERLSATMQPLQQLSSRFTQVGQQAQAISRQPITLNVQPALQALQQLLQRVQQVARQLQSLSFPSAVPAALAPQAPPRAVGPGFSSGGFVTGPNGHDRVPARLTAGEFVLRKEVVAVLGTEYLERLNRAPARVGAPLTETAPRSPAPRPIVALPSASAVPSRSVPVEFQPFPLIGEFSRLPLTPLTPPAAPARPAAAFSAAAAPPGPVLQQTNNQFGGIEIHLRETADVGALLLDLRRQGIGLRTRRG